MRKTYKGLITKLLPNQIFVFGSNTQGRHGAGAAGWAKMNAGAIQGQPKGFQGQSYAIITKDLRVHIPGPSIFKMDIVRSIRELYGHARDMHRHEFLIAYNSEGPNLNGYTPEEMAEMFANTWLVIPDNIIFEEGFAKLIDKTII